MIATINGTGNCKVARVLAVVEAASIKVLGGGIAIHTSGEVQPSSGGIEPRLAMLVIKLDCRIFVLKA